MEKLIRRIEVKIRQVFWSFRKAFRPVNYDIVVYKGEKFFIKTSFNGHDIWNLYKKGETNPAYKHIKGNELKIVHSVKRFICVFKDSLKFQEYAWGLIDCNNKIGTRLSYKNSEDIYFRKKY